MKTTKESLNNIVLILAIVTVISTFLGYVLQLGLGIPEAFYSIYSFFGGNGEVGDIQSSLFLQIAAFSAPLSVAMLIIFFFFQELSKWWFLTFRAKDHCIICGLGHMGMALAEDILDNHKYDYTKLIIIEPDESNPNAELMRLHGAIIIHGDATNENIMKKAKAKTAKSIIALTGSDISNLEIAITLAKMQALEPKLYVHLEYRENEALLQSKLFQNLNIKGFNTYDHAAQTLFMRLPLGGNVDTMGEGIVRVAIIGLDAVGLSVLYRVLNLGHFYNGKPIQVDIYDNKAKEQDFLKTYPVELDCSYWKITFHEEAAFYAQKELPYDQIIFCKRNTQESFADAMRLVRNKASLLENKEVFVFADSHEMIASLVNSGKDGVFKSLFTFGEFKKICAHDVIINEALDSMAIQTNARYNDLHGYNPKNLSPALQWKTLDPFLKDSNRMQVEHLFIKLNVINTYLEKKKYQGNYETIKEVAMQRWFVHGGTMLWDEIKGAKTLATYIPIDTLEKLAHTEKMRWNAFHILNGWKKLDIPQDAKEKIGKDKDRKLHPCLVPWEELDKVSKNHKHDYKSDDSETVMRAYEMAASISSSSELLSQEAMRFMKLMDSNKLE